MAVRPRTAVAPLVLVGLVVGGCGSTPAPGTAGGAGFTIRDYTIPPLTAAPGRRITIADGDGEPHTVTADDGSFDTGSFDGSAPGSLVAPTVPGTYAVHCTVHPGMHGTLTVR